MRAPDFLSIQNLSKCLNLLGLDCVRWIEFRNTGLAARNPSKHIHALRITKREEARYDFQDGVRGRVLVVVDIRLDINPICSSWRGIVFMKSQLYVGFSKLNLLVTASCSRVKQRWSNLLLPFSLVGGKLYLIHQCSVRPCKETVLFHMFRVPNQAS